MNRILKQIIIIITLSIGLGLFGFLFVKEKNFSLIKVEEPAIESVIDCNIDFSIVMKEAKNLTAICVKEYLDNGKATIIDSRAAEEYNISHIKGSINLYAPDFNELTYLDDFTGEEKLYLDNWVNSYKFTIGFDQELPFDELYIIYCNGGDCKKSEELAKTMYGNKFKRVFVYEDGLPDWKENGYSVEGTGELEKAEEGCQLNQFYFLFSLILVILVITIVSVVTSNNTSAVVGFRLILGMIFIYASYNKIIDPVTFSSDIDLYKATPITVNNLIALIVPWLELLIGFGLILNRSIKGSILIAIGLFIGFIVLLSQSYYRGFTLDCGCFGGLDKLSDIQLRCKMLIRIIEDIIYLIMSIYLYFIYIHRNSKNVN